MTNACILAAGCLTNGRVSPPRMHPQHAASTIQSTPISAAVHSICVYADTATTLCVQVTAQPHGCPCMPAQRGAGHPARATKAAREPRICTWRRRTGVRAAGAAAQRTTSAGSHAVASPQRSVAPTDPHVTPQSVTCHRHDAPPRHSTGSSRFVHGFTPTRGPRALLQAGPRGGLQGPPPRPAAAHSRSPGHAAPPSTSRRLPRRQLHLPQVNLDIFRRLPACERTLGHATRRTASRRRRHHHIRRHTLNGVPPPAPRHGATAAAAEPHPAPRRH